MSAEVLGRCWRLKSDQIIEAPMSSILSLGCDVLQELALVVARQESGTLRDVAQLAFTCRQLYDQLWLGTDGYWIHLLAADGRGKTLSQVQTTFAERGHSLVVGGGNTHRNVLPRLQSAWIEADGKLRE
jgi:hypothetical protein